MKKSRKSVKKNKITQVIIVAVVILLILVVGFFVYKYFIKQNNYRIENKYYGFTLQTPKGWVGEENTTYSEENITKIIAQCDSDKSNGASEYQIGAARFKSQRYPQDLGYAETFPTDLEAGAIFEVTVWCMPESIKTAEEKMSTQIFDEAGFGKTKHLYIFHNGLQFTIRELVYVPTSEKVNETKIKESYSGAFDKIVSSFKFTK